MNTIRKYILAAFFLAFSACGGGVDSAKQLEQAQKAFDSSSFEEAIKITNEALATEGTDKVVQWQLEQLKLKALAKAGKGTEAKDSLERLSGVYSAQVKADLYLAIASYVKDAGDTSGAIDILAAGDKRFPDSHDSFIKAIDEMKKTEDLDPAELEQLKTLGYL